MIINCIDAYKFTHMHITDVLYSVLHLHYTLLSLTAITIVIVVCDLQVPIFQEVECFSN